MFYTTVYQRYLAELLLFCFLVFFGLGVNSQTLIALGVLVLSHCLPSLVLVSIRQLSHIQKQNVPTFYSNGFCSFREKEIVELITCALMIGVSVGLLLLALQKLAFVPLNSVHAVTLVGLFYIALDMSLYILVNLTSRSTTAKPPSRSRIVRILVALLVIVIASIEHQFTQNIADIVIGLGVLLYVVYMSGNQLLEVARKNIDYTPRGITIEDVSTFMLSLPGVLKINRIYFYRINEVEHGLGVHVTLEHFLQENSEILKEKIKRQVEHEFGVSRLTIELLLQKPPSHDNTDPDVIVLGHQE